MTYSDFTLDKVTSMFGLTLRWEDLFLGVARSQAPAWLVETLARHSELAINTEKARSEFIVAPILVAVRSMSPFPMGIYSGQRLDVDSGRGLTGECDFILTATAPLPIVTAPLATIVEAKKSDIELGQGQCVAQMIAARMFNEMKGQPALPIYGCVTSGNNWLFLHLREDTIVVDRRLYYLDNLESLLAILLAIIADAHRALDEAQHVAPSMPDPSKDDPFGL